MPLYTFVCDDGHETERVRSPIVRLIACWCGRLASRSQVNRVAVHHPVADRAGMARRFVEASAEREHTYEQAEAAVGHAIDRPNDWAAPEAAARARVARGEVDEGQIRRQTDYHMHRGG